MRRTPNWRSTRSGGRTAAGSAIVVRTVFCRRTPCQPWRRIIRSTVRLGHRDALALQVRPHLHDPYSDSGLAPPVLVGFVVAGQDLGDRGVPQGPFRGRPHHPGVEGARGDRHTVLGQHAADRSDPETVPCSSMNSQISGGAGRSPARRKSMPPSGFRWLSEAVRKLFTM